jgi:electron transfer flavoprotein beta subunit
MKILVTAKRVIDPYAKVQPLADGSGIDTTNIKFDINPFDEIAIEEAVRIKEKMPDTEIIVASIGGAESEEQLRKALAMGADRAILIESNQLLDSPSVAQELALLANDLKPDIILMGKQATDDDNNQAAQMLAAILDWPQATFASKVEVSETSVQVTRETDTGEEILEMSMPCLITSDLRLNEPRYIALPGIIKARSKPLERKTLSQPHEQKVKVIKIEAAPKRQSGTKVSTTSELIALLKEKGVLNV